MLVSAAWLLPAVFAVVNRIAQALLGGKDPATPRGLITAAGDWLIYACLTPAVFAVSKRWPVTQSHFLRRISPHLAFSVLFCAAWTIAGKGMFYGVTVLLASGSRRATLMEIVAQPLSAIFLDWLSWFFFTLPLGVAVYLGIVGIEHAFRYFIESSQREAQVANLSQKLADARFAALQAQVNPHFLFNTLNTIAVFIRDDDRPAAVRIVEQLSEVLRTTLNSHHANEVTLGEELELVRQYVAIERERFSDRLKPQFAIDDSVLAAAIPSFALQHLVENAIRHGIAKQPDAGDLLISGVRTGNELKISVTDDGAGIVEHIVIPAGHGIANTRERLQTLHGKRASLTLTRRASGGTIAVLRIPYREITPESES